MIVLNFVLFVAIAVGQAVIYWAIQASSKSLAGKSTSNKDLLVAKRLLSVVMTDFACWFPIGLLGLLAK
jgi:hypothetical protein